MAMRDWDGKKVRDWLLFLGGFAGTAFETLAAKADRPSLLALFAGMMGLPLFLRRDERDDEEKPKPPEPDEQRELPPPRGG